MKNLEDMTPDELRELALQKEIEADRKNLLKEGVLKEDVVVVWEYCRLDNVVSRFIEKNNDNNVLTKEQFKELCTELVNEYSDNCCHLKKGDPAQLWKDDGWYCDGSHGEIEGARDCEFGQFVEVNAK
jgi:hypothetical protein